MTEATPVPRMGKYELHGELGRGAMGVVYRAYDRVLHRDVALKTMSAPTSDEAQTMRFLREARTAGSLHHPNIVTIHELGQESGTYFIAMELLEGRTLREMINSRQLPPINRRLELVARVCDGLDYAHRASIVHRDIKPANIFLSTNGSVKILDFGIAKIAASDHTRTGLLLGTVNYMSPEQVRAVKNLDGRADIFSAGVILYELLFHRKPFAAGDLGAVLHRILHQQPPGYTLFDQVFPAELAEVLRRSLDKRREARFVKAGEMAEVLDRVAATLIGRAGTELEERIEEVIASGVLERKDPGPPVTNTCCESETEDRPAGRSEPGARSDAGERTRKRSRARLVAFGGAVALLAVAAILAGRFLIGDRQEEALPGPRTELPSLTASESEPLSVPPPVASQADDEPAAAESTVPGPGSDQPKPTTRPAAPAPRGALKVLVMPWANIAWIENLDTGERLPSDESTPVRLELPAGRYRLRLVNPYVSSPLDLDAVVRAGESTVIRRAMPGFDAAELAREILASEISRGETQ